MPTGPRKVYAALRGLFFQKSHLTVWVWLMYTPPAAAEPSPFWVVRPEDS